MTVDTLSPGDPDAGDPGDGTGSEQSGSATPIMRGSGTTASLFVWKALPSQLKPRSEASQDACSYVCDLCGIVFGLQEGLRVHQLQLHINPFHLSIDERSLSSCDDYNQTPLVESVQDGLQTSGEEKFENLFRCHLCFTILNQRDELKSHLEQHVREDEMKQRAIRNAQRHEDFDDLDSPPPSKKAVAKVGKENQSKKRAYKRRLSAPPVVADPVDPLSEEKRLRANSAVVEEKVKLVSEEEQIVPSSNGRPERKCKTTTNTLVAISLEDERLDIKFEDSSSSEDDGEVSEDDKPLRRPSPPAAAAVKLKRQTSKKARLQNGAKKPKRVQAVADDAAGEKSLYPADQEVVAAPQVKRGRGRPRKFPAAPVVAASPPAVEKEPEQVQTKAAITITSREEPSSNQKNAALTFKRSPGRPRKSEKKSATDDGSNGAEMKKKKLFSPARFRPTTTIEDILPDLGSKPSGRGVATKRSVTEAERASQVVRCVTEPEPAFVCLACQEYFEDYNRLSHHSSTSESCRSAKFPVGKTKDCLPASRYSEACASDYSAFVSGAIRSVPETTFNNMHGTLHHVGSDAGNHFRSRPSMGAVERVRLNVSGPWTTKDVWESGGWEIGNDPLSWHKYESAWSESRRFLQRLSTMSWPQQRQFKSVFDQTVLYKTKTRRRLYSSSSESADGGKKESKQILPLALGLKQLGLSVKQTSAFEREQKQLPQKRRRSNNNNSIPVEKVAVEALPEGELNGEWELGHVFMCSVCSATFDELREVMHHKWDAHPYCLVAHVTLPERIRLPPATSTYPQLGRQLRGVSSSLVTETKRRASSSKVRPAPSSSPSLSCSKCSQVFEAREEFHKHLLVCGGDHLWDEETSKKKKKKKRKSVANTSVNEGKKRLSTDEAALRRKARFARFEQPTQPRMSGDGRMTRFQINMIKEIKKAERFKKKSKRGRKPGQKNDPKNKKAAAAVTKKSLDNHTTLPSRLRRSTVNYARDFSLRESWETSRSNSVSSVAGAMTAEMLLAPSQSEEKVTTVQDEAAEKDKVDVKAEIKEEEVPVRNTQSKRRASLDLTVAVGSAKVQRRSTRMSLDATILSRPASPTDKGKMNGDRTSAAAAPGTPMKDLQLKPSDRKTEDDSEESDNSLASVVVVVDATVAQREQPPLLPSRRSCSKRPTILQTERLLRRVVFPVEVKIGAIERIANGDTQSQVARDLQVPLSTVASWWHRRNNLVVRENGERDCSSSASSEVDEKAKDVANVIEVSTACVEDNKYPIVPYKRNELLLTMKKRIEEAFKQRDVLGTEDDVQIFGADSLSTDAKEVDLVMNRSHRRHKVIGDRNKRLIVDADSSNGSEANKTSDDEEEDVDSVVFTGGVNCWDGGSNGDAGHEGTRSSSGLSLILDSYKELDGGEEDEIS